MEALTDDRLRFARALLTRSASLGPGPAPEEAVTEYEVGAPVVLHEAAPDLWHIPRPLAPVPSGGRRAHAVLTLADTDHREYLKASTEWPTYCGLRGSIFVYEGIVRRRRCCAVCRERKHLADGRPGRGVPYRAGNVARHLARVNRRG